MPYRRGSSFFRTEMARMLDQFQRGYTVVPLFTGSVSDSIKGVVTAVNRVENKVYVAWNGGPVKQHDPDEIMLAVMPVDIDRAEAREQEDATAFSPTTMDQTGNTIRHAGRRMAGSDTNVPPDFVGDPDIHGIEAPVSGGFNVMQELQKKLHVESEGKLGRRMAMYHGQRGRMYRRTRAEVEQDGAMCPKCRGEMEIQPFTRNERIWICSECGWKISTGNVIASIEKRVAAKSIKMVGNILEDIAEEVFGEVRDDYSGRGMFGATCYGITVGNRGDAEDAIKMAQRKGLGKGLMDNMGLGTIAYWPHYKT